MSENLEKELQEIETLRSIKTNVQKEIERLQIILGNLQTQEHTAQIKSEQDDKIKDVQSQNKYAEEERRIEIRRIEAEKRIDLAETKENNIASRETEVEKREQRLLALEEKEAELNKKRANFEIYKTGIEKELEFAKNTIAEANAVEEKIEIERQSLVGREKKIKEQEKYWNDCIGLLEEEKKKFEIEKENILGLRKVEVANV